MKDETAQPVCGSGTDNLRVAATDGGSDLGAPPIEAVPSEESAVETIGMGAFSDGPEEYAPSRPQRPRFRELVATVTIRDQRVGPILRESTVWLDSESCEDLAEGLAKFMKECEETVAQPCWINTGILRLDEDHRAELLDAREHLREERALPACDRVVHILRQADDTVSPRTLAAALVEVSYLVPRADRTQRNRPGLTHLEVLRFLDENDFPVILYPTETHGHCVSSMEFHVVAADLAACEKDPTPGDARYFVEVVRNRAGSESAVVYPYPRPAELADDIVWSVDKPSVLPERFHRPRIADGTYFEAYDFIGLRSSYFAESYKELAATGLPPKVWASGRVVPPWDVLEGRLGKPDTTAPRGAARRASHELRSLRLLPALQRRGHRDQLQLVSVGLRLDVLRVRRSRGRAQARGPVRQRWPQPRARRCARARDAVAQRDGSASRLLGDARLARRAAPATGPGSVPPWRDGESRCATPPPLGEGPSRTVHADHLHRP